MCGFTFQYFYAVLYVSCVMSVARLLIPESPRWLAVHARYDEVTRLLKKMCRANKRELPADFDAKCLADRLDEVTMKVCQR